MIVREVLPQEKDKFDAVATHPLQSWAWGDFRTESGVEVIRLALFEGHDVKQSYQITIHPVPRLGWNVGYYPRGPQPDDAQIFALNTAATKYNLIFVKNEPNVYVPASQAQSELGGIRQFLESNSHQPGRPMFTSHSFVIDLTKSEDELFAGLKQKTRYNVKLAQNNTVTVTQDDSQEAFEDYIKLWKQTTRRQAFYAHDETYQRQMWKHMKGAGIAHILKASFKGETLAAWIVFVFNNVLYYPYGASTRKHRDLMANNLLAWETIRFGKSHHCHTFDMWGSLGPEPDKHDPWYGFHRFKAGYGGELVEFAGTYDYVVDPQKYLVFTKLDRWRWKLLRFRSKLPF